MLALFHSDGAIAMAEIKTKKTESSVTKFIAGIGDKARREDATALTAFLKKAVKAEPKMWGSAIIGFGSSVLKYPSGREMDWFPVGFSPRKAATVIYFNKKYPSFAADVEKLEGAKLGGGCVYIKRLDDIDLKVLKLMVDRTLKVK